MHPLLLLTFATFHGWWTFTVPELRARWHAYIGYGDELKHSHLRHVRGGVAVEYSDPFDPTSPLDVRIETDAGCYLLHCPPTFSKPKRRIDGTVTRCASDSALGAFVARRR